MYVIIIAFFEMTYGYNLSKPTLMIFKVEEVFLGEMIGWTTFGIVLLSSESFIQTLVFNCNKGNPILNKDRYVHSCQMC